MSKFRLPIIIAILLSILFLPYWVYIPLLFAGVLVLPFFWEGILLGLLVDTLYAESGISFSSLFRSFAFWTTLMLLIMMPVRRRLRTYA